MSEYTTHRAFIHDIANELAVIEACIKITNKTLPHELRTGDVGDSMENADKHMKICIDKLKEYRTFIHQKEKEIEKSE